MFYLPPPPTGTPPPPTPPLSGESNSQEEENLRYFRVTILAAKLSFTSKRLQRSDKFFAGEKSQIGQNWFNLEISKVYIIFVQQKSHLMAPSIHIKNISELPIISGSRNDTRKKISCITIGYREAEEQFSSDIHLDAFIILLVLSGKGHTVINYKAYDIQADTLLLLSSAHLFHFYECSDDFQCQCLFVSKAFTDEMDSTDMIYRRTKYGVRLYNQPVVPLAHPYAVLLAERLASINKNIDRTEHFYHKEVILNRLFAFYLDLSDILERTNLPHTDGCLTRYESIIKSFIELLATHYREEHKVDFYAAHLNLSAHHLTQIVKLVTGQSVSDFIFEMLFSEARNLLTHSKLSIQEIATTLNFSDQSSFGKFFKRKAGVSPIDFRKDTVFVEER